MSTPLRMTFRDMDPSASLDAAARKKLEWLEDHHAGILSCHVVVEAPPQHHRHGGHFRVRVELGLPGGDVIASHSHAARAEHDDCQLALRDAFAAARRQLEDISDRRRHPRPVA